MRTLNEHETELCALVLASCCCALLEIKHNHRMGRGNTAIRTLVQSVQGILRSNEVRPTTAEIVEASLKELREYTEFIWGTFRRFYPELEEVNLHTTRLVASLRQQPSTTG